MNVEVRLFLLVSACNQENFPTFIQEPDSLPDAEIVRSLEVLHFMHGSIHTQRYSHLKRLYTRKKLVKSRSQDEKKEKKRKPKPYATVQTNLIRSVFCVHAAQPLNTIPATISHILFKNHTPLILHRYASLVSTFVVNHLGRPGDFAVGIEFFVDFWVLQYNTTTSFLCVSSILYVPQVRYGGESKGGR